MPLDVSNQNAKTTTKGYNMSVATLVKKKEHKNQTVQEKEIARSKRDKRRRMRAEFDIQVKNIMHRFEASCFNINSTEKEVADFIVDWKGQRSLSWADSYFHAVKLSPGSYSNDRGDIGIHTHKSFQAWK